MNKTDSTKQTFSIYDQIKPIFTGVIVFLVLNFIGEMPSSITYAVLRPLNAPEDVQMLLTNIHRVCELAHVLLMIVAGLIFAAVSAKKFPEHINYLKTERRSIYGQIFICIVLSVIFLFALADSCCTFSIPCEYENPGFISYVVPMTFNMAFDLMYMSVYALIIYIPYVLAMRLRYIKR